MKHFANMYKPPYVATSATVKQRYYACKSAVLLVTLRHTVGAEKCKTRKNSGTDMHMPPDLYTIAVHQTHLDIGRTPLAVADTKRFGSSPIHSAGRSHSQTGTVAVQRHDLQNTDPRLDETTSTVNTLFLI